MNRVWENSSASGGELLVLLAIADHANDRGSAWPGIDSLARKSRLTTRHVTRCLNNLAAAGELQIHNNRGCKGTNLYQVSCFPSPDNLSALPTKSRDDIPCQADRCLPQMSPEPSEPSEPSTHTIDGVVVEEGGSEWPTEEEVILHTQAYPGNTTIGVPAKAITREWASAYWSWRTFDAAHWPKQWEEELIHRFEREWRNGGPAARGIHKKNSACGAATGLSPNVVAIQTSSRVRDLTGKISALEDEVHQNRGSNMPFNPQKMRQLQLLRAELKAVRVSGDEEKS